MTDMLQPLFLEQHPEYITEAFGTNPHLTLGEITTRAEAFLIERVPLYSHAVSDPEIGFQAKCGNCVLRSGVLHGLVGSFDHIQSSVVASPGHTYNVFVEKQGIKGVVAHNGADTSEIQAAVVIMKRQIVARSAAEARTNVDKSLTFRFALSVRLLFVPFNNAKMRQYV